MPTRTWCRNVFAAISGRSSIERPRASDAQVVERRRVRAKKRRLDDPARDLPDDDGSVAPDHRSLWTETPLYERTTSAAVNCSAILAGSKSQVQVNARSQRPCKWLDHRCQAIPAADSTSSAPRSSRPPRRSKAARADRPELTKVLAQTSSLKTEFLAPGKRAAFRCGAG